MAKNNRSISSIYKKIRFVLIFCFFTLSSCSPSLGEEHQDVINRVQSYFQYEKEGSWEKVYSMRPQGYRDIVNEADYIQRMRKDHSDLLFKDYSIIKSDIKSNTAEFLIKFYYVYINQSREEFSVIDVVVWEKMNGEWYCINAATRGFFPLNYEIEK